MKTPNEVARDLIARGYKPVPIPIGSKGPTLANWPRVPIGIDNVDTYFQGPLNIGVQMGQTSGGLTDVDLDCAEAVELAEYFLPKTHSVYGRSGKRRSHHLYICRDAEDRASIKLSDEQKACIIELRLGGGKKGAQSLVPGSIHPSGEPYEWDEDDEPAEVSCADLKAAIVRIAAGVLISRHWPSQRRHDAALRCGGFFARVGWEVETIGMFLEAVQVVAGVSNREHVENGCQAAMDQAKLHLQDGKGYGLPAMEEFFGADVAKALAKIVSFQANATDPISTDGRPIMKVIGGNTAILATLAEEVLLSSGIQFYQRSNILLRPVISTVETFRGRRTTVAHLLEVTDTYMRDVLSRVASWWRMDLRSGRWISIDPPGEVASIILSRSGEWKFPVVSGVITTQTLRPDGSILFSPGYDAMTRLLLVDPPPIREIKEKPTREDALRSLKMLEDLLSEFPLDNDVSQSVALSCLITPVVRGAFPVAPMHAIDAPIAGSGKSYLLDTAAVIAIGELMPVIAAGRTEEETEKRLGAALLASQSLITLDNVNGELGGDALCQIVERPRPQVRILGKSELVDVESRGTSLFANGNNLIIVGDLGRRVIRCRLDPQMEEPELRDFTGSPVSSVLADRGAYVSACLTICRAYISAGRPGLARRLASFEGWSDTVRSALIWLGKADPVASMAASKIEDPERAALLAMLETWSEVIGTGKINKIRLKEVVDICNETQLTAAEVNGVEYKWPDLNVAVKSVAGKGRIIDLNSFGYWMRSKKNRVVAGMRFERIAQSNGTFWWVQRDDNVVSPGSGTEMRFGGER